MTKAPPSNRAYESGTTLGFGLISVPVNVFTGLDKGHGISRKWFTEDGHPVGLQKYDKITEQPIVNFVSKIETEHGPVYVEDHEIEALFKITPKTITVQAFQPRALFGTAYVPKAPFFIEPTPVKIGKRKVPNEAAIEALGLFLAAMEAEDAIALVEFTTRGVPQPAVLLPDGTLWVIYHEDELREQRALAVTDPPEVKLQMGITFIKTLWKDEPIDTTDVRSALIQGLADEKAQAGDFTKPLEVVPDLTPADAPSDLMALLAASVAAAKAA